MPSNAFTFNACFNPRRMPKPFKVDDGSFTNNLIIGWEEPDDDGGCPITGYAVFRDDANGGNVTTEVNTVNDTQIRNNPTLRRATITNFTAASQNQNYRFMVRVFNREGYADSPYLRLVNSGNPQPVNNKVQVIKRNCTSLHVQMPTVSDDDYILSYELQIDNGLNGEFVSVGGFDFNTK